jgi:hypothetical protein
MVAIRDRRTRKGPAQGRPQFPHPSVIRGVNLVVPGFGESPSVAAILLGRRQAEEIAKTRAPSRPTFPGHANDLHGSL